MPGPRSSASDVDARRAPSLRSAAEQQLAAAGVLDEVRGGLGDDERDAPGVGLVEAERARERRRAAARLADRARVGDRGAARARVTSIA